MRRMQFSLRGTSVLDFQRLKCGTMTVFRKALIATWHGAAIRCL